MLSSCSPIVLFGHLTLPPPRSGSASRVSTSLMCPSWAQITHFAVLWVEITYSIFYVIDLMIWAFIEVRITYSSQHNQLPAVWLYLLHISHLLPLYQWQDQMLQVMPLPANPLLVWIVRDSFQKKKPRYKNRKQDFSPKDQNDFRGKSLPVCVSLCFIKPILGNRYVQSRGFIVSESRETHPRSEIADVPT